MPRNMPLLANHLLLILIWPLFGTGVPAAGGSRPMPADTHAETAVARPAGETRDAARTGPRSVAGHIGTPIGSPLDLEGDPTVEGIAFGDTSRELFVLNDVVNDLDGDGVPERGEEIQIYAYNPESSTLALRSSFTVPPSANTREVFSDGRGLAVAEDPGGPVLYTLSSRDDGTKDEAGRSNFTSRLWRIDLGGAASIGARTLDLDRDALDLRHAEVFDVACDKRRRIYISFDASKEAAALDTQRARGILRLENVGDSPDGSGVLEEHGSVRILPANGKTPNHHDLGLTSMEMDDHEYLIGSIEELSNNGKQEVYVAEAETGRGLFKFDAPPMTGSVRIKCRGSSSGTTLSSRS
jgi:hypothetical protein